MPTLHIAQAHATGGGTTYLYEFCFDASPIGAAHTTEIPMVFDTVDSELGSTLYAGVPQAQTVARDMSAAWRAFATNGDPGWPAYDAAEQLTRIIDVESRTARYPEQASQQIWANNRERACLHTDTPQFAYISCTLAARQLSIWRLLRSVTAWN
jgi:para-nitrobenzyl esterase